MGTGAPGVDGETELSLRCASVASGVRMFVDAGGRGAGDDVSAWTETSDGACSGPVVAAGTVAEFAGCAVASVAAGDVDAATGRSGARADAGWTAPPGRSGARDGVVDALGAGTDGVMTAGWALAVVGAEEAGTAC